jgi:hypothetical protein
LLARICFPERLLWALKKPLSSLYRRSGYGILRGFTLECVVVAAFYLSPMNQDEIKAAAKSLDDRIWFHTVGVTNTKRIRGPLLDGRRGDTETTGTGSELLEKWGRFTHLRGHHLDGVEPVNSEKKGTSESLL